MANYHLPYANPKTEQQSCKFSYSPWCPTCEVNSPRRRSRSETNEPCRRKCREMKTATRRSHRSQEYENMDVDYAEPKASWYEPKERVRSNLVELPTSYITNNHQTPPSLVKPDRSNGAQSEHKMKQEELLEVLQKFESTTKTYLKKSSRLKGRDLVDAGFEYSNLMENDRCANGKIVYWRDNNTRRLQRVEIGGTYPKELRRDYEREMELMKEKLQECRHVSSKADTSKNYGNFLVCKPLQSKTEMKKNQEMKLVKSSEHQPMTRARKVSLKTRTKLNVMKLKRAKSKTSTSSSAHSDFVKSDYSDSDEGETNIEGNITDDEYGDSSSLSDTWLTPDVLKATESEPAVPDEPVLAGGDNTSGWPIRPSLFPNMPPYISFNSFDTEVPSKVPSGRGLFKWKLSAITPVLVRRTLTNSGFILVRSEYSRESNQWLGTWGKHMKSPLFKTLKDNQKLNHFPGTFQLGRKDRLWRNFQKMINRHGYKEFGFLPQTFVLPQELKLLKQNWEFKNGSGGETWIIKPPASARGVGIKVINRWSQLPKKMSLVVQKYITNPYLINGSKFDLRLYVLVTSFNPLRIYLYPEGLARFASSKYSDDAKDLKDRYMHLTNYSINKLSSQYTANEDANLAQGHKWTLTKLFEYLEKNDGVDTKQLWKSLQQLVIKTIISAEAPINQMCQEHMSNLYNCYELFGVDVLLDDKLKPWLLEVNISPSLHSASPLDAHVKGPMVQMLFDLAQFHLPPRLAQTVRQSPQCYMPKLYSTALKKKEQSKHTLFLEYEKRADYLEDILDDLTGDDVRRLTQAEDELTVKGRFERIFPTSRTHKYLGFMEPRYYNRLFDAWEARFEDDRATGIATLQMLCAAKVHLRVAPQAVLVQNSPSTTHGVTNQPPRDGQNPAEATTTPPKLEVHSRPLTEAMKEVSIHQSPSNPVIVPT